MLTDDPDNHDLHGSNGRGGVGKQGFAFRELKPEIVDVLGAGFDAPRGEGVGGQAGLKPIGEGLRVREGVGGFRRSGDGKGHNGKAKESARVKWECDFGDEGEGGGGFGGGEEKEERKGSEDKVRDCGDWFFVEMGMSLLEVEVVRRR